MLSTDPAINPVTGGWALAHLYYCDGGSFSGDRSEPIDAGNGTLLYFRGSRILHEVMTALLAQHGLDHASEVVVTGGSAGGLSAYLHANYIRSRVPSAASVVVMPLSGFFLDSSLAARQDGADDGFCCC